MEMFDRMSSKPVRRLYFRNFRVLRAKRRVFGRELPSNRVLVKLRALDQAPYWVMLERVTYDREKRFRNVCA
jgi:hypothetical protein